MNIDPIFCGFLAFVVILGVVWDWFRLRKKVKEQAQKIQELSGFVGDLNAIKRTIAIVKENSTF